MLIFSAAAGCDTGMTQERFRQLDQKVRELGDQVEKLQNDVAVKETVIQEQKKQIAALQQLGDKRLEKLYTVREIRVERLTGPANYDGKPGNDGITVYIQPIDRDGHVIKAAGAIRVELFDLANPDGKRRIGEYRLDVDHAGQAWYGRLMTNHYTLKCPWRVGPPAHDEITVRAEFTEYLTGKSFRAQHVVKLKPR
jgi:hypothetical protein